MKYFAFLFQHFPDKIWHFRVSAENYLPFSSNRVLSWITVSEYADVKIEITPQLKAARKRRVLHVGRFLASSRSSDGAASWRQTVTETLNVVFEHEQDSKAFRYKL